MRNDYKKLHDFIKENSVGEHGIGVFKRLNPDINIGIRTTIMKNDNPQDNSIRKRVLDSINSLPFDGDTTKNCASFTVEVGSKTPNDEAISALIDEVKSQALEEIYGHIYMLAIEDKLMKYSIKKEVFDGGFLELLDESSPCSLSAQEIYRTIKENDYILLSSPMYISFLQAMPLSSFSSVKTGESKHRGQFSFLAQHCGTLTGSNGDGYASVIFEILGGSIEAILFKPSQIGINLLSLDVSETLEDVRINLQFELCVSSDVYTVILDTGEVAKNE